MGETTVTVYAMDGSGNTGSDTFTVTVTQWNLEITTVSPADNAVVFGSPSAISAAVTDWEFIPYWSLDSMIVDSTMYVTEDATITYTDEFPTGVSYNPATLSLGWHTVEVAISDDYESTTVHWRFLVAGTAITIYDEAPGDEASVDTAWPIISAYFADNGGTIDPETLSVTLTTSLNAPVSLYLLSSDATHFAAIPESYLPEDTYTVAVSIGDGTNTQSKTWTFDVTPETTPPPAAPTALAATPASSTEIDLSWTDNSNNESGFEIVRGTYDGAPEMIFTVADGVTTFADTGLDPGKDYYYYVFAYNDGGYSDWSNEAEATTTTSGAPTGIPEILGFVFPTYSTRPTITWTPIAGASYFVVHITDVTLGTSQDIQVAAGDPGIQTFTAPPQAPYDTYSVTVAAGNPYGVGGPSASQGAQGGGAGGGGGSDVAYCPKKVYYSSWQPDTTHLGTLCASEVATDIVANPEPYIWCDYRNDDEDLTWGSCSPQSFIDFAEDTGVGLWATHGLEGENEAPAMAAVAGRSRDQESSKAALFATLLPGGADESLVEVIPVKEPFEDPRGRLFYAYVKATWFALFWAQTFNGNRAIVFGGSCKSLSLVEACNPRFGYGYWAAIDISELKPDAELLFGRMNGDLNDQTMRRAGDAWHGAGFCDFGQAIGEGATTLWPAVDHPAKPFYSFETRHVNPIGPEAGVSGDGYVIFDTHCDRTVDASLCLTGAMAEGGYVDSIQWEEGSDFKITFKYYSVGGIDMTVHKDHLHAEGGGAQKLIGGVLNDDGTGIWGMTQFASDCFWHFTHTQQQ